MRVGWFERIALKHVHCHMSNRWTVQVRWKKQGTQNRCSGRTQSDRVGKGWERGLGWGEHVYTCGRFMLMYGKKKKTQFCNYPPIKINFLKRKNFLKFQQQKRNYVHKTCLSLNYPRACFSWPLDHSSGWAAGCPLYWLNPLLSSFSLAQSCPTLRQRSSCWNPWISTWLVHQETFFST